ncbi:jg9127 [Pararge aegeria aegeria]|uniref:Jg9127 protein n=1 Tax=Pararge aegeria aegeria TaxID=348720 RepID=A0A8S4QLI9_9NEOP|nr:jg9127 [Pararge aegeria aegeria]
MSSDIYLAKNIACGAFDESNVRFTGAPRLRATYSRAAATRQRAASSAIRWITRSKWQPLVALLSAQLPKPAPPSEARAKPSGGRPANWGF